MIALARCGKRAEALIAFQQARAALRVELDIEPGRELQELALRLREDERVDTVAAGTPGASARPCHGVRHPRGDDPGLLSAQHVRAPGRGMRDTRRNEPGVPGTASQRRNRPSGQGDDAAARRERGGGDDRKWLKQPGDSVAKYEPLLEVITDKVNAEVPLRSPASCKEILVEEGATVPNNAEIAVIETAKRLGGTAPCNGELDTGRACVRRDERGTEGASAARLDGGTVEVEPGRRGTSPRRTGLRRGPTSAPSAKPPPAARRPLNRRRKRRPPRRPASTPNARMTPAVRRLLREHDLEPLGDRRHRRRRPDHPRGRARRPSRLVRTGQKPAAPASTPTATPSQAPAARPAAAASTNAGLVPVPRLHQVLVPIPPRCAAKRPRRPWSMHAAPIAARRCRRLSEERRSGGRPAVGY